MRKSAFLDLSAQLRAPTALPPPVVPRPIRAQQVGREKCHRP